LLLTLVGNVIKMLDDMVFKREVSRTGATGDKERSRRKQQGIKSMETAKTPRIRATPPPPNLKPGRIKRYRRLGLGGSFFVPQAVAGSWGSI
jgi:hypothetical protein